MTEKKKKLVMGWVCVFLGLVLLLLLFSIGCVLVMFGPPFEVLGPGFDPTGSVRLFTWSTFFLLLIPWVGWSGGARQGSSPGPAKRLAGAWCSSDHEAMVVRV
jgi:hypothetical protein